MLRRETGAIRLVAFNAETRHGVLEQMGCLLRGMRVMAIETSIVYGSMLELDFRNDVPDCLVATDTKGVPSL